MQTKQSFITTDKAQTFFGDAIKTMKCHQLVSINGFLLQKVGEDLFIIQEMV